MFLHFNKILGKGDLDIANVIRDNKNLEVYNISFNNIGEGIPTWIIEKQEDKASQLKDMYATSWAERFRKTALIRVDIYHNNLLIQEIEIIDEGLRMNNTI